MGATTRADEVVFFIPPISQEQLNNIRKLTGHMGYKIVAFAHTLQDLKKELLHISPMLLLIWDEHSIEDCKNEFYELIIQFQQHFYMFARGLMHHPAGNVFTVQDHIGELIGEKKPAWSYKIQ
ncbi:hypothetical protein [Paenibacillus xylanexedens]|uniref:hypothetical protein n=1 Tax=Paenibacillus xylanexedens TaxID=528191 RepID=UPI0011A346FA|nr:hypothetical protein [Paenibacillus xylanexedens]